jgi:hypothetical protein
MGSFFPGFPSRYIQNKFKSMQRLFALDRAGADLYELHAVGTACPFFRVDPTTLSKKIDFTERV